MRIVRKRASAFLSAGTVLLLGVATGCSAKQTPLYTSCSSDGKYCATIIVQTNSRANSSDLYHVTVKDVQSRFAWSHWANKGLGEFVVATTEAKPSRIVWSDNRTLYVICDSCKMQMGDVFSEKTHVGAVNIIYTGFVKPLE